MKDGLRLHAFIPKSRANGPGDRAVIWVQGCSLGCVGCFNPETHSFHGGEFTTDDEVFERILLLGDGIEGITISGGEPLQQARPVLSLLRRIRTETGLSSLVFTGYTWEEVQAMPLAKQLTACIDVLIAGRYDRSRRFGLSLIGSANKTVHFFTDRYTMADLQAVPVAEIIVDSQGDILVSGIDPPRIVI